MRRDEGGGRRAGAWEVEGEEALCFQICILMHEVGFLKRNYEKVGFGVQTRCFPSKLHLW